MAEQAVLDLVPLARARGQMADTDAPTALIGEALQCPLPQPSAGAGAAAAVRGDQQLLGLRIHRRPHLEPPGPDRRHREGRRVMVHADAAPSRRWRAGHRPHTGSPCPTLGRRNRRRGPGAPGLGGATPAQRS